MAAAGMAFVDTYVSFAMYFLIAGYFVFSFVF